MKIRFLKYLVLSALFVGAAAAFGAEPSKLLVTAEPREFPAGDWTRISITSERELGRRELKLPEIPGARWHTENAGTSRRISVVNGRSERSFTYTLPLSASRPGELVIPAIEVRFSDGETARSEPLKLRVLAAGEAPKGGGAATGRIVVSEGRKSFYVGEEIPVEFELSVPAELRLRDLEFPRMECDGPAVLPDLSGRRTRHPHFYDPREGVRNTSEGTVRTLTFRTALRFMNPGSFTLSATEALSVAAPPTGRARSGRFGFGFDDLDADDFFADPFGGARTRRTVVTYPAVKLAVAPVPEPPAGSHALELFGEWRVTPLLSARTARVGEPVELELKLEGAGSLAGFRPPKLEFPDFRVYPPELKEEPDGARSVRYALIPLRPGEYKLDPEFALFDTATGSYRKIRKVLELAVSGTAISAPPAAAAPPVAAKTPPPKPTPAPEAKPPVRETEAAPEITVVPGEKIELPLTRRGVLRGAAAFGVLALAALVVELGFRLRARRRADGAGEERRRHTRELIRRVERGEDVNDILRSGGMAALARALGVPEESTGAEVAMRVADPDLREVLETSELDAFAPESARHSRVLTPKAKKELLKLLKRSLVLVAVLFVGTAAAADAEGDPATWARRAYAGGVWDAVACRNAGVAFRRAGDLPRARLHLERAHLLAPRDERIATELERVACLLGETAEKPSFWALWRDFFRPDEYLAFAGACFGLVLLTAALLRRKYRRTAFAAGWFFAAAGVLAAALAWSQYTSSGSYRESRAVVTAPGGVALSALPVATGGGDAGKLNSGAVADVVETRGEFVRLRGAGASGWCRRNAAERIFPAKTAPGY